MKFIDYFNVDNVTLRDSNDIGLSIMLKTQDGTFFVFNERSRYSDARQMSMDTHEMSILSDKVKKYWEDNLIDTDFFSDPNTSLWNEYATIKFSDVEFQPKDKSTELDVWRSDFISQSLRWSRKSSKGILRCSCIFLPTLTLYDPKDSDLSISNLFRGASANVHLDVNLGPILDGFLSVYNMSMKNARFMFAETTNGHLVLLNVFHNKV